MNVSVPASPLLSSSQLEALAEIGEERSAPVGELLYRVGDRIYPFIAILEGEVAIVDAVGNELIRQGPSGFLGELNLLSGQTLFVSALVVEPLRYIAVERGALRSLLNEDGPLSDLLLSTFISRREALQTVQGIGLEIVGPHGSEPTMRMLEFARANRLPYTGTMPFRAKVALRHSCGCPAEESCTAQPLVRCCAHSGSDSSSHRARRSTC
jgi:thioredoxin reductase (NADPH)